MGRAREIFKNMFSTNDPIEEFRRKQGQFVESMRDTGQRREVKDYSVERTPDSRASSTDKE